MVPADARDRHILHQVVHGHVELSGVGAEGGEIRGREGIDALASGERDEPGREPVDPEVVFQFVTTEWAGAIVGGIIAGGDPVHFEGGSGIIGR